MKRNDLFQILVIEITTNIRSLPLKMVYVQMSEGSKLEQFDEIRN